MRLPNEADGETPIRPSLMEALIDEDPDHSEDRPVTARERLRVLRERLREDLESLLNTRQRATSIPEDLRELSRSVFDYGVPDLSGADLASKELRDAFLDELARRIRAHDSRFHSVHVESLETDDPHDRTLRLRIEAVLRLESRREDVKFDFRLEPVSRHFEASRRERSA